MHWKLVVRGDIIIGNRHSIHVARIRKGNMEKDTKTEIKEMLGTQPWGIENKERYRTQST